MVIWRARNSVIVIALPLLVGCGQATTNEPIAKGRTYYIRTDGGTAEQCSGTEDRALSPDGNCAWNHPFEAFGVQGAAAYPQRISGGDTIYIRGGEYRMGYTEERYDKDTCYTQWRYDCYMAAIPSGTDEQPTRIIGDSKSPPVLYGVERANTIVNLDDSSHIIMENLEITDRESCGYNWLGNLDGTGNSCNRTTIPYGDWASTGIRSGKSSGTPNSSSHVTLRNINVHGLASNGLYIGHISDWTMEGCSFSYNGFAGIDGDYKSVDGKHEFRGTIHLIDTKINANGCIENWETPGEVVREGCYGQLAQGYGDGIGLGGKIGDAQWIFEGCEVRFNTSDGLDFLYAENEEQNGSLILKNSIFEGNAGNQVKTALSTLAYNNIVIGNCDFFNTKPEIAREGTITHCRGGGGAFVMVLVGGNEFYVLNNSFTGTGPYIVGGSGRTEKMTGEENIYFVNNLISSQKAADESRGYSDYFYIYNVEDDFLSKSWHSNNNIYHGTDVTRYDQCEETGSICANNHIESLVVGPYDGIQNGTDVLLSLSDKLSYDLRPTGDAIAKLSPLQITGLPPGSEIVINSRFGKVIIPEKDFEGENRPRKVPTNENVWTIGAFVTPSS